MNPDFIIFIEHRARELENACLLEYELKKRGYKVLIANVNFWRSIETFMFCKPRVVVTPWLYDDLQVNLFHSFRKGPPKQIVNLQSEQIYTNLVRQKKSLYPEGKAKDYYHVCWGSAVKKYLLESGIKDEKLLLSGSIGTDFDDVSFRTYFPQRKELADQFQLDNNKKWCLFISSFSMTTYTESQMNEMVESFKIPEYYDLQKIEITSKATILEWINKFTGKHPEYEFIYRPHPGELQDDILTSYEKENKNFHLISDFSIKHWINTCDSINTWMSTSIVDVYFLGKNSSVLRPDKVPYLLDNELFNQAYFIDQYNEFETYNMDPNSFDFCVNKDQIEENYLRTDRLVYKKICDELEMIYHESKPRFKNSSREDGTKKYNLRRTKWYNKVMIFLATRIGAYIPISRFIKGKNRDFAQKLEKESLGIYKEMKEIRKNLTNLLSSVED